MYSNNNCDAHNELLKEPVAFEGELNLYSLCPC
jgi:hypothetical protein